MYKITAKVNTNSLNAHEKALLRQYGFKHQSGRVFLKDGTVGNLNACVFYKRQLGKSFNIGVVKHANT